MSKDNSPNHQPDGPLPESAEPEAAQDTQATTTVPVAETLVQSVDTAGGGDDIVAQLQAELKAAKDRELRCHAELDNYRKRATRELDERLRYANLGLVRDLLPVVDNVQRAIEAGEKNSDATALLEGFKMVHQQIEDVLKRHHATQIEALYLPFDPNIHHAILQQPSEEHPANTVLMVTQSGYQLHDRVVRPAQVIVSTTKSE